MPNTIYCIATTGPIHCYTLTIYLFIVKHVILYAHGAIVTLSEVNNLIKFWLMLMVTQCNV